MRSHSVKPSVMPITRTMTVLLFCAATIAASAAPNAPPAKTAADAKTAAASKTAPATPAKPGTLSKWQQLQQEKYHNSAPADEYFGKMKMSYLGINNTYRDAAIASGDHTTNAGVVSKVAFADDALAAWSKKYPKDPQLARTYFLAIESDKRIWLQPNQQRAWTYMNRIVSTFGDTYFGKIVKKNLGIGFTEHYYAEAVACATAAPTETPAPAPATTATEAPRRGRGPAPTPTPSPTPTATPTPSPTPSPVPTPRAIGKGLKVMIETPPCVPPATPSPTALPTTPVTSAPLATPAPGTATRAPLASPAPSAASPIASPSTTIASPRPSASPSLPVMPTPAASHRPSTR
ncbi:hypothetical protein WPS_33310 [Vulcanimicrobium alpinum]|uniref:Uncharacterized protein n=2 Tax=Vulcanimicrobium alpinum TaxID=3016050 RepID=A0AAN2CAV2_UNVUL|nr:hypothetical protein WPS_33310 [Vulcanimicrobium alpinum]